MGIKLTGWALAPLVAFGIGGCSVFDKDTSSQGAAIIFDEDTEFEKVNIFTLLYPESKADRNGYFEEEERWLSIEETIMVFQEKIDIQNTDRKKLMRNRVQDRIIAASIQRCNEFKRALQKYEGDVNFLLGSLTTALAGAGSIFTGASTARALSGIAGISSGLRAEFNSDYFKNLSIEVVTKGITARRERLMEEMGERKMKPLAEYTTLAAIGDALKFHGSCTVIAGLEEASDSITKVVDPGPAALLRSANDMIELRERFEKAFNIGGAAEGEGGDQTDGAPNSTEGSQTGNGENRDEVEREPVTDEN